MKNKANITKYLTGVTALTALTASSQAAIVYWNPADITISIGEAASFDMLTGIVILNGSPTASAFMVENYGDNYAYLIRTDNLVDAAIGGDQMERLAAGSTIDGSQAFGGNSTTYFEYGNYPNYPWNSDADGTNGYLGLRFAISGETHYAWAQFTYNDISNTITLQDFAYEDIANTGILAGAIPEPSSLLLLAGGAVLAARRKRTAA